MKKAKIKNVGYQIFRPLLKIFVMATMWPKTVHKERIPKNGGIILAGNHLTKLDPIIVGNTTPRSLHFLSKKELLDIPVLGSILNFMGVIPVDRSAKSNPEAKNAAIEALKEGYVVTIFPEGTRNKTKEPLMPFKYGAVSFAYKSGCPIVPFAIIGKPKIFKYGQKVIIGKPFYVKSDDLEKENQELVNRVLELIKEGSKIERR